MENDTDALLYLWFARLAARDARSARRCLAASKLAMRGESSAAISIPASFHLETAEACFIRFETVAGFKPGESNRKLALARHSELPEASRVPERGENKKGPPRKNPEWPVE
jgi:hypothetical protein